MKKIISRILFILTIVIFMFGIYVAVFGATDVISKWEEIEATGYGGMEYMAVGTDILAVGVVMISVIGAIMAIISAKIAQSRALRIISLILCPLNLMMILICFGLLISHI